MKILFTFVLILCFPSLVIACSQSWGPSETDKKVANMICKAYSSDRNIESVTVSETLVDINVSRKFYLQMRSEKLLTQKAVKATMETSKKLIGSASVTVTFRYSGEGFVEGQTTILSGDQVKWLMD